VVVTLAIKQFKRNVSGMRKLFLSLLFAAGFIIAATAGNPDNGKTKVNVTASKVEWVGYKVTGKHTGTVAIKEGTLDIKDGMLAGGMIVIDMNTIKVTDLSGEYAGKLEGHLKSDDFFGVAAHPTATLHITESKPIGIGQFEVKADLTIRGKTNPVTFTTALAPEGKKFKAITNLKIDRTLYDVKYGSGKFFEGLGDTTIYDEFDLAIVLVTE
jgi:polyisoprenoid-binding protein YceI